jgi:uncharacterized protein (TIGR02246 family)
MRRSSLAALAGFLVSACSSPAVDVEAERVSLRAAAEAYQAAASAKDAAAVVGMYDEEAVMVPPDGDLVEGLDAVRQYRFGFIETPGVTLSFDLVRVEVAASGDVGWTLAIGDITIDRGDEPPGRDVVRDVHTWKKQEDGSWKVVLDAWNSGPVGGS